MRDGKPNGFHFLDHRTIDVKCNSITDLQPLLACLQDQIDEFGYKVEDVALNAGYFTSCIFKKLPERNIFMVMGVADWKTE